MFLGDGGDGLYGVIYVPVGVVLCVLPSRPEHVARYGTSPSNTASVIYQRNAIGVEPSARPDETARGTPPLITHSARFLITGFPRRSTLVWHS